MPEEKINKSLSEQQYDAIKSVNPNSSATQPRPVPPPAPPKPPADKK